eukprot:12928845-Prorocentrum_lima.AAC.1
MASWTTTTANGTVHEAPCQRCNAILATLFYSAPAPCQRCNTMLALCSAPCVTGGANRHVTQC